MNDQNERFYTSKIVLDAETVGAKAFRFSDKGRREFNPTPFDNIVWFPLDGHKIAFVEMKIGNAKLTDKEFEFAKNNASNHITLRVFPESFYVHTLNKDRIRICDTLQDCIEEIKEMI